MNIYLSGSHGTGKSTTARVIADTTDLGTPPSVSRMSPYQQGTVEHQEYVMDNVYKRCAVWDKCIHERTPLDVFAYTIYMGLKDIEKKHEMKLDAFARIMEQQDKTMFYFPISFPLVEDGVRPDEESQTAVDDIMRIHIERTGMPVMYVPDGTPEERAEFILRELPYAEL